MSGTSITYTFTNPGIINITLSCTDSIGLKANASAGIVILKPEVTPTPQITTPQTTPQVTTPATPRPEQAIDTTMVAVIIAILVVVGVAIALMRRRSR